MLFVNVGYLCCGGCRYGHWFTCTLGGGWAVVSCTLGGGALTGCLGLGFGAVPSVRCLGPLVGISCCVGCPSSLNEVAVGEFDSLVSASLGLFACFDTACWKISASLVSASIVVELMGANGAAGAGFFKAFISSIAALTARSEDDSFGMGHCH